MAERRREVAAVAPDGRRGGGPLHRRDHRPGGGPAGGRPCTSGARPCAPPSWSASAARLGELDDRQVEAVEALTHGIVAKLLHDPTVGLKDAAGTARGERLAEALRDLFNLE